jgi:putative FmdB family regulatory protein
MFWLESIDEARGKLQSSDRGHPCHPWLIMVYNLSMPIYEYECRKCGAHVEAFQKVNDKPLTKCRKCGGKLDKKISAPAIQFKGSGWYVTDYAGKTTKGEKSESESTAESKSDKPEKKTKENSPAKKTADKPSSSKASTGE